MILTNLLFLTHHSTPTLAQKICEKCGGIDFSVFTSNEYPKRIEKKFKTFEPFSIYSLKLRFCEKRTQKFAKSLL